MTHDPLSGEIIDGRYQLVEVIGRGGTGTVYRARQLSVGREVAFKLLSPDLASDPNAVSRFEREGQTISKLRHPNTLRLIDSGSWKGRAFIVTELLSGRALSRLLNSERLDADRTVALMRAVTESLAEAHELGMVHRDLKPSNLFIERVAGAELVKVMDFGIAKVADTSATLPGEIVGTPLYMSPEQIRGEEIDGRSDIYSLGVIAYECLAGRAPFVSASPSSLFLMHLEDLPAPFCELSPPVAVPPALEELVREMLSKHPDDRPTADVLRTLLASDLEQTRARAPLLVNLRSDRPLLTPLEQSRFERAEFRLVEGVEEAEFSLAVVSPDELRPAGPVTLLAIDGAPDEVDPGAVAGRSLVIGPLPLEGKTLGVALSWLRRPSCSVLELVAEGAPLRTVVLRDSAMKARALEALVSDLERRRMPNHVLRAAERVADELLMNALFHAPVDELGRPTHADLDRSAPVALHPGQEATLQWFACERFVAVAVSDPFGSMQPAEALAAIAGDGYQRDRPGLGAGLGLRTALKGASELVVAVLPRSRCEVVAMISPEPRGQRRKPSLWMLQGKIAGLAEDPSAERIGGALFMRSSPGEERRIELAGKIDETADLQLVFAGEGSVVLDLASVRQINSAGVLRWIHAWDGARGRQRVSLESCPPDIVEQLSSVAQFADGMDVRSLLAPFYCADCRTESLEPVRRGEQEALTKTRPCRCGGSLELAESPEVYFAIWR